MEGYESRLRSLVRSARQRRKMHRCDQPLAFLFRDGQGEIEGKSELFPILFAIDVPGRHQPTHLRGHATNSKLIFKFLFSLVETLEKVLVGHLDLTGA